MRPKLPSERGQAIILIALAIVGLLGLTALAVDGGNAYSERRRAQNAADTTALDAALAKVRGQDMLAEGLARASSNRYTDSDPTAGSSSPDVNVEIYNPPISGPYAGDAEYVQTIITATVKTYFGRVLGITEVTNRVEAVARAVPPTVVPPWFGHAIVGLSPDACKAVTYQGNAGATLTGGGIFVNSNCSGGGNQAAFFNNSGAAALNTPGICSVGSVTYAPGAINLTNGGSILTGPANCPPSEYPVTQYVFPNAVCTGDAALSGNNMTPGNWNGNLAPPPGPDKTLNLAPGMYCVDSFDLHSGDTVNGDEVIIVVRTGTVTWNGGANINLTAPTSGDFKGLLIYVPYENGSTVTIAGNFNSTFTGTILAPASECKLLGTSGSVGQLSSQVICYTVYIGGESATNITYNAGNLWQAPVPPSIELSQ